MRRVAVIFGSRTDLNQCLAGLELIRQAAASGQIDLVDIRASSIHRATRNTLGHLEDLSKMEPPIDVLLTAAGWANHLTGVSDAFLRYELGNTRIVVVGVALEDGNPRHSMAARLSITEVPGTQVVFRDDAGEFVGADGFRRACEFAVQGALPEIKPPKPRPVEKLLLDEAIIFAREAVAVQR